MQSITSVGFQPEGVFIKRDASTVGPGIKWAASGVSTDSSLTASFTGLPITGTITALISNGFTLGTTGSRANGSTFPYHYFAFAPQAAAPPAPEVTNVSPTSGPASGGQRLTITGTNFTGATGVTIDGTAATNVDRKSVV